MNFLSSEAVITTSKFERQVEFSSALGNAVSRWAQIEGCLYDLLAGALNITAANALHLATTHRAFAGQLDLISVAMRLRLKDHPGLAYWNSLEEYIRELSGDRNYLVHSPVIRVRLDGGAFDINNPDEAATTENVDFTLGPPLARIIKKGEIIGLTAKDIWEIKLDFDHAISCLIRYEAALSGEQPFDGKFPDKVVRRRPPRMERQRATFQEQ